MATLQPKPVIPPPANQPDAAQPDAARINALRGGNPSALDEFYRLHRRVFVRWSEKRFSLDATEAVDIYQDAVIILYENITRGKLDELKVSLKTYFFSIGKNLILKRIARIKRERERQNAYHYATQTDPDPVDDNPQERLEAVASAFEGLSERNQSILKLYYYHRLPFREIADRLGYESVDVVKNQKVRCLRYLRKLAEARLTTAG
ncbi:MAG: sigma-70 family RNA polymerase sigma factor [Ferruginibacter sp.]|nr:sigma-70 family RNA polymerase sigma factor [Cytophagales bacterium]